MNWGIVWSVIVALVLFMLAMAVICVPVCLVMMGRMKKRIGSAASCCSVPGCSPKKA